ncbi:hypothetical protein L5515_003221 [Caenorhabditis briggsae]|uniref:Uncharacterized protein n=1 Tax=Caenorhabditis briggsae TaxID=6238 RepID=A0AAE9EH48_CAEBR|nr:hypothetical protein L5515_003221 [Caenorhabditis briggsae]
MNFEDYRSPKRFDSVSNSLEDHSHHSLEGEDNYTKVVRQYKNDDSKIEEEEEKLKRQNEQDRIDFWNNKIEKQKKKIQIETTKLERMEQDRNNEEEMCKRRQKLFDEKTRIRRTRNTDRNRIKTKKLMQKLKKEGVSLD